MKKKSIILQFEKPAEAGMTECFRAVIEPDDPITKCTIESTFIPEHPSTWSSISSGFSFCRASDTYDLETGMRLALKSALRSANKEMRARFWALYLTAHPVTQRAQLAEIKKAEEQIGAALTRTAEEAWARMFADPSPLEVPRLGIFAQHSKANGNGARFSEGDQVRHIYKPEWGIGKIEAMEADHHDYEYLADGKVYLTDGLYYKVRFHNKEYSNSWWTLEQNLTLAKDTAAEKAEPTPSIPATWKLTLTETTWRKR